MPNRQTHADAASAASRADGAGPQSHEYPVREYIGAMAQELAQMARWDGDDQLGCLLEAVSDKAAQPAPAGSRETQTTPRPA